MNSSRKKRNLFKIIILGDSSVGKTSLLNQYVTKQFSSQYKATIGADFMTKDITINDQQVSLQIWDTAGHERFASFGTAFYRGADVCMLVCDVTVAESFDHLEVWKKEFISGGNPNDPESFPYVIIGNKVDCEPANRAVSSDQLRQWCTSNGYEFFECSAKTGWNVDAAFTQAATLVAQRQKDVSSQDPLPSVHIELKPEKESTGCC
ncbi:Ras-related protein Rab-7b [Entamoeba marina]